MIKGKENRSYNEQLECRGDLPKVKIVRGAHKDDTFAGSKVIIPPPLDFDELMKSVPYGKLITSEHIRKWLAKKYDADYTCPVTARKSIVLAAHASVERSSDKNPYWRTLKKDGELNANYPNGIEDQRRLLELEGHTIAGDGARYYVIRYTEKLHHFPCRG